MRAFSAIALLITSALAFTVTEPNNNTVWTSSGGNTVNWTSVATDRSNFTILLTNQQTNPVYSQVLKALVPTSDGTTTVNPPSSGWPNGKGFQVNIVQDSTDLSAILAQSPQFSIAASASSSKVSSTLRTTSTTGSNPSSTSSTSGAAGGMGAHTGFIAAVALLGAALA